MRRRIFAGLLTLLPSLGLAGCGTSSYSSTYQVTVEDPAGLFGAKPIRVSLFDVAGGSTKDWATRSLGSTAPGKPYAAKIATVETRTAFDGGPPAEIRAGLFLPDYRSLGWYLLELHPEAGTDHEVAARFIAWDGYAAQGQGVPPLAVVVRATASGKAWALALTVRLGEERPDEQHAATAPDPLTQQLIAAAGAGNRGEVERLLLKGALINGADAAGRTPVIAAARAGQIEVARYLIQFGADVNLRDAGDESAYLVAASHPGPDELLVAMLNGGARIGSADGSGSTALIRAASKGRVDAVRRLLAAGEPVNHVNAAGRSALHEALIAAKCTADYAGVVTLLVREKADVNASTGPGTRPLELARAAGCLEIADILARAGARAGAS